MILQNIKKVLLDLGQYFGQKKLSFKQFVVQVAHILLVLNN